MSGLMLFLVFLGILCAVGIVVYHSIKCKELIEEIDELLKINNILKAQDSSYQKAYEIELDTNRRYMKQIKKLKEKLTKISQFYDKGYEK